MASAPKHLSSLRRANAELVVSCRACRHRQDHDPGRLTRQLIAAGGNLTWSELPRQLPCPACGSADVRVAPGPLIQAGVPGLSRAQHQRLVTLALRVLDHAAYASRTEAVAERVEVQLALRVLLPYVLDRRGLLAYWEQAQGRALTPWSTCREHYYMIAKTLRDAGWHAPVDGTV